MTDLRQAAQQAPKSRPCDTCNASYKNDLPRIIRCGTCVVRPGQMPTKWRSKMTDQLRQAEPTPWRDMVVVTLVREGINKHKARELADHFATPPQRPWVGLTDEEILRADPRFGKSESDVNPYQILGSARDLEAKLKERNHE